MLKVASYFCLNFGSIIPIFKIQLLSYLEEYSAPFWSKNKVHTKAKIGRNRTHLAPQK